MIKLKNLNLKDLYGQETYGFYIDKYSIFRNEDVQKWIIHKIEKYSRSGKDPKKFATSNYLRVLQDYCDFYKCNNPTEFLKEDVDTRNKRLINYLNTLIREGKNETTVTNSIQSKIRSFYSDRGSPTSDGLPSVQAGVNKNEVVVDRELIKRFKAKLNRAEYRLILKIQCLLGLRIGDILNELTSGKYKIQKYKQHNYIKNFKTKKENVIINFLFFPKELNILMESIYGEIDRIDLTKILMTKSVKHAKRDANGFILRDENGKMIMTAEKRRQRINKHDYLERLKKISRELGITENVKTHCFRKYFSTQIRNDAKELTDEFKAHLMGHKSQNLSSSYNQRLRDIKWFYKNWKKAEAVICIDCEIIDKTNEMIVKFKEENIKLREQIEIILKGKIETDKKIDNQKNQVKELTQENKELKDGIKILKDSFEELEDSLRELRDSVKREGEIIKNIKQNKS